MALATICTMTAPGDDVLTMLLLSLFLVSTGYAAGRLHQWYRMGTDRDEAYRDGYDTATRSVFSMAVRLIGPRRPVRATATVIPGATVPHPDPAVGSGPGGRSPAVRSGPGDPSPAVRSGPGGPGAVAVSGAKVPANHGDELAQAPTRRLTPDRLARAGRPDQSEDPGDRTTRLIPKPRAS